MGKQDRFTDEFKQDAVAQLHPDDEDDEGNHRGPIWFFTSTDASLTGGLGNDASAFFTFTSKGGDVFAHVAGRMLIDRNRSIIDDLWNPFVAAWYEGGQDDPKLVLLRFDPDSAEVWLDASSILAGLKLLLGRKPQQEYSDNVAKVAL